MLEIGKRPFYTRPAKLHRHSYGYHKQNCNQQGMLRSTPSSVCFSTSLFKFFFLEFAPSQVTLVPQTRQGLCRCTLFASPTRLPFPHSSTPSADSERAHYIVHCATRYGFRLQCYCRSTSTCRGVQYPPLRHMGNNGLSWKTVKRGDEIITLTK